MRWIVVLLMSLNGFVAASAQTLKPAEVVHSGAGSGQRALVRLRSAEQLQKRVPGAEFMTGFTHAAIELGRLPPNSQVLGVEVLELDDHGWDCIAVVRVTELLEIAKEVPAGDPVGVFTPKQGWSLSSVVFRFAGAPLSLDYRVEVQLVAGELQFDPLPVDSARALRRLVGSSRAGVWRSLGSYRRLYLKARDTRVARARAIVELAEDSGFSKVVAALDEVPRARITAIVERARGLSTRGQSADQRLAQAKLARGDRLSHALISKVYLKASVKEGDWSASLHDELAALRVLASHPTAWAPKDSTAGAANAVGGLIPDGE